MRRLSLLALCALSFAPQLAHAQTLTRLPQPSVTGTLYRFTPAASTALPAAGLAVYVAPSGGDRPQWVGPSITGADGRFSFYRLTAGQDYTLRVYNGSLALYEQIVRAPRQLDPVVLAVFSSAFTVYYYPRPADGDAVAKSLSVIPHQSKALQTRAAVLSTPTNTLWFGDRVAIGDAKLIAETLVAGGVKIRAVKRFAVPARTNESIIEIGASEASKDNPPLSLITIAQALDFPRK
jgi:hypothetical protein